jgi:hypothetical protein
MHKLFKIGLFLFFASGCLAVASPAFSQDEPPSVDTIIEQYNGNGDINEEKDEKPEFGPAGTKPVSIREVPPEEIEQMKNDPDFWYADLERTKPVPSEPSFMNKLMASTWFKTLVWLIIGLSFFAVIIMYLSSSNVKLFRRRNKNIQDDEEEQEAGEDIFSIDYNSEIRKAMSSGDHRRVIRFLYLKTLRDLSDRDRIKYSQEKTNRDYVSDLAGSVYYKDFFRLTLHFEYAWYGKFDISGETFQHVQSDFSNFQSRLTA